MIENKTKPKRKKMLLDAYLFRSFKCTKDKENILIVFKGKKVCRFQKNNINQTCILHFISDSEF